MDVSREESFDLELDGIDMHVVVRGKGEPLVLLHGGGGAGVNWNGIFDAPVDGFQLVIPDLRGHGASTNPSGEFSFRQCALDVLAMADRLKLDRFKAIGVSLGAKTLLHVATLQPQRVTAMVLVSATPYFPDQARAAMAALTPETLTDAEWAHSDLASSRRRADPRDLAGDASAEGQLRRHVVHAPAALDDLGTRH